MTTSELRERLHNGLRDFKLYAGEAQSEGRRFRMKEVARNLAIGLGATSFRGEPIQFTYRGYKIPLDLAEMTGAGDESWDEIAMSHLGYYEMWTPIRPDDSMLEIGCGIGRDAIHLATHLSQTGRYIGLDICRPSIEWCRRNISARHPNFEFRALDIRSDMYNPGGKFTNTEIEFPVATGSVDRVALHSVFTHMFATDIEHYLCEIARVLKPDAKVLASFFIFDAAVLESAASQNGPLTFTHAIDETCRVNDPDHPEAAVAYTHPMIELLAARAGLRVRSVNRGFWSGAHGDAPNGQDVLILEAAADEGNGRG